MPQSAFKHVFSFFILFFVSLNSLGQVPNDFEIGGTIDSDQRIFLNYRFGLNNNRVMNIRLSQGWSKNEGFLGGEFRKVNMSSDTIYEASFYSQCFFQTKLIFGPEFKINESNFSYGIEAILGYRSEPNQATRHTHDVHYSDFTPNNMIVAIPATKIETYWIGKRHFMTFGLQGRFSISALATEKLGIRVFGELGLEYNQIVSDKMSFNGEPLDNPTPLPDDVGATFNIPLSFFAPQFRVGASIFLRKQSMRGY